MRAVFLLITTLVLGGCGVYTFNQSALPSHLKSVAVPLFQNKSLDPGVADELTTALARAVPQASNQLRLVQGSADATLNGSLLEYSSQEFNYNVTGAQDATIADYLVKIVVEVSFMDNRKGTPLYEGTLVGEGAYDAATESEEIGRKRALDDVVKQIIQNSIQGW
jgi:putative lipoic acid-binding regulatory protein